MNKKLTKTILKNCKKEITLEFLVCIILRGILLIIPILYSNAINFASITLYEKAIHMIIIYIVVITIYKITEYLRQRTFYNLYNKMYKEYTVKAVENTCANSIFSLSRFTTGEYMNILNSDIDTICSFFCNAVYRSVQILEFIFIYYYFYTISMELFIVSIVSSIIILLGTLLFGSRLEKLNKKRKDSLDIKTGIVNDIFTGIKEIKGFNILNFVSKKVETGADEYVSANAKYNREYNLSNIIAIYIFEIIRLVMLIYGIYMIKDGYMEIGILMIIYSYFQKIIDNFTLVSTVNVEYRSLNVSLKRYNKIVEYARKSIEDGKFIDNNDTNGKIEFKNILYGYKNDPVLKDFNLKIREHSIYSITGVSDSGKMGIFELLLKLNRQHEGNILVDNNEISEINDEAYYKLISYARSNPIFFDCSIRDNLMLVEPDFSKIEKVCKMVKVHDDILKLKDGYDTIIGTDCTILSSTMKKLLSIVRVILKDSRILLFDEIIDSLDKTNKKNIIKVLQKLSEEHTILIITRDKGILKLSDEIILLDQGKVEAVGRHNELMETSDIYKQLY